MSTDINNYDEILASVNSFVDDLKQRISIYTSASTTYISPREYNLLCRIVYEHTRRDVSLLKNEEVPLILFTEMEVILNIIYQDKELIEELLKKYNSNVYIYNSSSNMEAVESAKVYFEKINKQIQNYVLEYNTRTNKENEYSNSKIDKLNHYVELFTKQELTEYMTLEEYKSLVKDMATFGLLEVDYINILKYLNIMNINLSKSKSVDSNLTSRVSNLGQKYLIDNDAIVKGVTKLISEGFDLEMIPTIAESYAKENDLPAYQVQNTMVALIINSYYHEYVSIIKKNEDIKLIKDIRNLIEDLFSLVIRVDELVLNAKKIILLNNELINNYIDSAYDYINLTKEEIEAETGNVYVKTVPLLVKIKETVDHIDSLEEESEEYNSVRKLLEDLISEYQNIVDRIEENNIQKK